MTDLATYFAFTSGPKAAEADWSMFAKLWATDGVVRGEDSEFLVQPHTPNNLSVDVLAGQGWIQGDFGRHGATVTFAIAPDGALPRKDIVVLRVNWASHKMELLYRTGTAAGSPVAPTPTRTPGVTWDIVLAEISVAAAAGSIVAGNITDRRPFSTSGGVTRVPTVTNASPLVIPNCDQVPQSFMVVAPVGTGGPGSINNIQAPTAGYPIVILEFASTNSVVTDTGNLRMGRSLVTQANTVLALMWDGTSWRELYRAREVLAGNLFMASPSGGAGELSPRLLTLDDFPAALWTTSNPTTLLSAATGVTFTTNQADLLKMGKFFKYQCRITLTSNGPGAPPWAFTLTLPFSYSAPVGMPLGTFMYINSSGGTINSGVAAAQDGTSKIFFLADASSVPPGHQPLVNEQLLFTISGKLP